MDFREHKKEWSGVGAAVFVLAGGGAYAWWIAAAQSKSRLPHWPAFVFIGVAVAGFCLMLAPLLSLPPWHRIRTETRTPLEEWIEGRLTAVEALERQRGVRKDRWFFKAMEKWDTQNAWELMMKVAPDLADGYRADPRHPEQVDGINPPHTAREKDAYFARRLGWLRDTLRGVQHGGARKASKSVATALAISPSADTGSLGNLLGSLRERGLAMRRELKPPTGYATSSLTVLDRVVPALPEQRVRAWASRVRLLLEKSAPRFLAAFDVEPDLPPPHMFGNIIATTKPPQLLAFLDRKLEALEAIIVDLNRGS